MTAYNRQQYIGEAIESVLNSSYKNFELIIVDDSSSDSTLEIAKNYAKADYRISVHQNKQNLGDYPNRNRAASFANGHYIMYVDSDDKIHRDGIGNCVHLMQRFPNSSFGMCIYGKSCEAYEISTEEVIREHFFKAPLLVIGPGGTILRKSFFDRIGGYPEKYGPANDRYFNLKAASQTPMVLIPFEFLYYRIHEGQEINNQYSYILNNYLYLKDALAEIALTLKGQDIKWLNNKNKRRFFSNLLRYYFESYNFSKTIHLVRLAKFNFQDMINAIFQH